MKSFPMTHLLTKSIVICMIYAKRQTGERRCGIANERNNSGYGYNYGGISSSDGQGYNNYKRNGEWKVVGIDGKQITVLSAYKLEANLWN